MLVLSRKPGEKVVIDDTITLIILEMKGNRVRIGFEAPDDVRVLREELAFWNHDLADLRKETSPTPSCKRTGHKQLVLT